MKDMEKEIKKILEGCCECNLCIKECSMLEEYTTSPKELFGEILEKGYMNVDKKIAYSCNLCNQCTLKCPKNYDFKKIFFEMREKYVKNNNGKSPISKHKAVEMHQYLSYKKIFNTEVFGKNGTEYIFYPGCSLSSYYPEEVGEIVKYLNSKLDNKVGAVLKCCGKPLKAMGKMNEFQKKLKLSEDEFDRLGGKKIIVACQNCYMVFKTFTSREVISLWELLGEIGVPEKQINIGKNSKVKFNIHDSCPTREIGTIHQGIRNIIEQLGYSYEDIKNSKEKTRCCGLGGMVGAGVPEIAKKIKKRRQDEMKAGKVISYCAGCREAMETENIDSLHIVELIFGKEYTDTGVRKRNLSPVAQWKNRYKTKKILKNV